MPRLAEIPYDETTGRTLMLLMQTSRLISKYIEAYFYKKADISFTKFLALKILASKNKVRNPVQLAEWTQTEMNSATMLIDRMKKDGLVTSRRKGIDRRRVYVYLTEKGRTELAKAMPVARELMEKVMSPVVESDAVQLERILKILRDDTYKKQKRTNKKL